MEKVNNILDRVSKIGTYFLFGVLLYLIVHHIAH